MAESPDRTAPEPDEQIMYATYRALQEHGYADLTVKRIADEYGKSTAAIHYHYDTKEDLMAAFLDFLLDKFVEQIHEVEQTDPQARLNRLLDKLLVAPQDHLDLLVAVLEMWSQTPYDEEFATQFQHTDEYVRYVLQTVIDHGIKNEVFADVDAEAVAHSLMTIVDGGRIRAVVHDGDESLRTARRTAQAYLEAVLRPDGNVGCRGADPDAR